jgi:hypothetical protein
MQRVLPSCRAGSLAANQAAVIAITRRLMMENRPQGDSGMHALQAVCHAFQAGGLMSVLSPARIAALDYARDARALDIAAALAAEPVYDIAHPSVYTPAGYALLQPASVTIYLNTCGAVLSQRERWKEACDVYRNAGLLAAGEEAASLRAAALRNQLLMALIGYDSLASAPRRVSQSLDLPRLERDLAKAYTALARACDSDEPSPAAILAIATDYAPIFESDGTQQLVGSVHEACILRRVRRLGDTYTAVPMAQVAAAMSGGRAGAVPNEPAVAEALAFVTRCIGRGHLAATVDPATRQLTFVVEEERAGREAMDDGGIERLTAAVTKVQQLVSTLRSTDAQLTLQPTVLKRLAKGGKGGRGREFGIDFPGAGMGMGAWDAADVLAGAGGGAGGGFGGSEAAQMQWATRESLRTMGL